MSEPIIPQGFILSDAAMYSFLDQQTYPDLIAFANAIPEHLRQLFLIPVMLEMEPVLASRIANSLDADLFAVKTFLYDDDEPASVNTDEGSIFQQDNYFDRTHHQENAELDFNDQTNTDTSIIKPDPEELFPWPYRTKEKPQRHSSLTRFRIALVRLALKPDDIQNKTTDKIKNNAETCSIKLISFDPRGRIFTFGVNCGNGDHKVRLALSEIDQVAVSCDCNFWRWNGPEYNAKNNKFLLDGPRGDASKPDIRDPNRKYWLCKHAYAALKRLDHFVEQKIEQNWEKSDEEVLHEIDEKWNEMEEVSTIPLEEEEPEEITEEVEEQPEEPTDESNSEDQIEEIESEEEEPEDNYEIESKEEEPEDKKDSKKKKIEEIEEEIEEE